MNILKLADLASVERFLDFSTVPHHDYFPLDDFNKEKLDEFYRRIPLKTRVLCPKPESDRNQERIRAQAEQVNGRDSSNQALNDFQAESIPGPTPTLLNLSITLIDALQLEFGLVEDRHVFLEAMRLHWSD